MGLGVVGPTGAQGPTGPAGAAGPTGPTGASGISGLTTNTIPKATSATTLGDSSIKDDGTAVTITQNSVVPFTSVAAGAVVNTLYLNAGRVGILTPATTATFDDASLVVVGNTNTNAIRIHPSSGSRYASTWGISAAGSAFLTTYDYTGSQYRQMSIDSNLLILQNGSMTSTVSIGSTSSIYSLDVSKGVALTGTFRCFDQTATTGATTCKFTPGASQTSASVIVVNDASQTIAGTLAVASTSSASQFLTATNCSSAASPAVCAAASAGSVVVAAAATTVVVNTTAVTANSQILVFYDSALGTKLGVTCNATEPALYGVTARTAATSFTITATSPITNPACFSYLIIN
jgi:hypothetical protein